MSDEVERWVAHLGRRPPDEGSMLGVFARLLKVTSALGHASACRLLEGKLQLSLEPALAHELSNGSLFVAVRQYIQRATPTERAVFQGLFEQEVSKADHRSDDHGLLQTLRGTDPWNSPREAVRTLSRSLDWLKPWEDLSGDRSLSRGSNASGSEVVSASEVGPGMNSSEVPPALLAALLGENDFTQRMCDLLCEVNRHRYREHLASLRGSTLDGVPLWMRELAPPTPVVRSKDSNLTPLFVLFGECQTGEVLAPRLPIVRKKEWDAMIQNTILRFLPSGACAAEVEGYDVSVPSKAQCHLFPPSVAANVVVFSPLALEVVGPVQSYKVGWSFDNFGYQEVGNEAATRFSQLPDDDIPTCFEVTFPVGFDTLQPWQVLCAAARGMMPCIQESFALQSLQCQPHLWIDDDADDTFTVSDETEYEVTFNEKLRGKIDQAIEMSKTGEVVRQTVGKTGLITKTVHGVDARRYSDKAIVKKVTTGQPEVSETAASSSRRTFNVEIDKTPQDEPARSVKRKKEQDVLPPKTVFAEGRKPEVAPGAHPEVAAPSGKR